MTFVLCSCCVLSLAACASHVITSKSPAAPEQETAISTEIEIIVEQDEPATDGVSYPIMNADPSVGAFGHDLLHLYSDELVHILNQWLDAHRNGIFKEIPNHHPVYPSDFPPVSLLPIIDSIEDVVVAWRESVMLDAYTELGGGVYVVVPIGQSHIYVLEPAMFSDEEDNISIGFGYSGFQAVSMEEFIVQSEIDFWFGGGREH